MWGEGHEAANRAQPAAAWRLPEEQVRQKHAAGPDPHWIFHSQLRQARETSTFDTRMRRGTPGVVEAATTVARAEGLKSELASEGAAACLVCPCRSWSNT